MPFLGQSQLLSYRRNGFLIVPDFATPAECGELRVRAAQLVDAFDPRGLFSIFTTREQTRRSDEYFLTSGDQIRFFFEEEAFTPEGELRAPKERSINKIGHALHDLDPVFARFSRRPELAAIAADLGYLDPLLVQSMYIYKQPGIGGEVGCHQDSTFLYTDPPSTTGFWVALEDATVENGCLWGWPGGHLRGLKSRFVRDGSGGTRFEVIDEEAWPPEGLIPLEAPAGTLIILDGLLPHLSCANRSARSRQAYTLHLIEGRHRYPADNWLQRSPDLPWRGFAPGEGDGNNTR